MEVKANKGKNITLYNNKIKSYKNDYKEMEEKEDDTISNNKCVLNYEKLYYEQLKESKISYNYAYKLLDRSKEKEESYKVEKIII